jgi:hypothetical protein
MHATIYALVDPNNHQVRFRPNKSDRSATAKASPLRC